jgi:predicted DNA binding protein
MVTLRTATGKKIEYNANDPDAVAKYAPIRKFNDDGTVSYTNKAGDISYRVKTRMQSSTKMAEADDAYKLVSAAQHPMEMLYADYANQMKSLANSARKEMMSTGKIERNASATKTYQAEVDSLLARLNEAEKNSIRERQAIRLANAEVKKKQAANPDMDKADVRKESQKAMTKARQEVGSVSRRNRNIKISDREWEAIQAGAISKTQLKKILNNTDVDVLREKATPRTTKTLSDAKVNRIKAMSATYTIGEIAEKFNISPATVSKYLKGVS